jgi:tol-pal system protein YbgF
MTIRSVAIGMVLAALSGAALGQSSTGPLAVEDRSTADKARNSGAPALNDDAVTMLLQQLQQYEQEMQQLRGMVEKLQNEVDTMKAAERERYLDLDARINALAEASLKPAGDEPGGQGDAESSDSENDRADYMAAREKLLGRDFTGARQAFESYLDKHPEGEFRPFAHFWLGEVYRSLPDVASDKAMARFSTVVNDYPDHSKVPAALYKLASLQAEAGEKEKARVTLNKILLKYPDSSEARLAKSMLVQLGGEEDD